MQKEAKTQQQAPSTYRKSTWYPFVKCAPTLLPHFFYLNFLGLTKKLANGLTGNNIFESNLMSQLQKGWQLCSFNIAENCPKNGPAHGTSERGKGPTSDDHPWYFGGGNLGCDSIIQHSGPPHTMPMATWLGSWSLEKTLGFLCAKKSMPKIPRIVVSFSQLPHDRYASGHFGWSVKTTSPGFWGFFASSCSEQKHLWPTSNYWWLKSGDHQLRLVVHLIIYKVLYVLNWWSPDFWLPSTVVQPQQHTKRAEPSRYGRYVARS